MEWHGLTSREWATVFWFVVLVSVCIAIPSVRGAFSDSLGLIIRFWQLHVTVVLLVLWVAAVCLVMKRLGAWNSGLLKDTVSWVVVYGVASIFSANRAAQEDRFFRCAVMSALRVTALMQFVLNLHTFHFVVELALVPVVTVLVVLEGVAGLEVKTRSVQRLLGWMLAVVGFWVLAATAHGLWESWRGLDPEQTGLALAFSLWFPLVMLPFVYALSLQMTYSSVFRVMPFRNDGRIPPIAVKAAVVVGLRGNLRAAHDLREFGAQYNAISRSRTYRGARECVDAYLSERDQSRRDAQAEADRLIEYAGVHGIGQDERLLDQREVGATTDSLRWIHTCQMGWHNNDGEYRRDLLDLLDVLDLLGGFEREGLPTEHGITMRVSRSGQSWYAWRRLPIGQVLAIGADGPPPSEWLYEGEEPPDGLSGHDRSWAPQDETPPDWR